MHMVGSLCADLSKAQPELKDAEVREWLDDARAAGDSVIYVATGTLVPLGPDQVFGRTEGMLS